MKRAIRAFREAMARQREKRAAAREAERARRARLEQMYEAASNWLEKAMGVGILQVAPQSNNQSLHFEKTEYGAVRYVPEHRPGFGIVPDRVEYVQKQDASTQSNHVHLGYTNYLKIKLENAGGSGASGEIELHGEVLYNEECLFSGHLSLEPPKSDWSKYLIWLPLYGQPADLCEPINRAYELLRSGWSLGSNGGTILNDLIFELETTRWWGRDVGSLARRLRLDKKPIEITPYVVVRLLARERGDESWNLLLQQRVIATHWIWGPIWDVDIQGDEWEVQPERRACVEWENSEYVVECEEEDGSHIELLGFQDVIGTPKENLGESLQKVAELFKAGLLTEEEFHRAKTKLIDSNLE